MSRRRHAVTEVPRRSLLAGGLAATLGAVLGTGLAGCTADPAPGAVTPAQVSPTPTPDADGAAVACAREAARALAATAQRLAATRPGLVGVLRAVRDDHVAHLAALGAPAPSLSPGAGASSPAAGVPAPSTAAGSRGHDAQLGAAITAERDAARAALDDVTLTSPAVAALLARIAAARATHADLLAAAAGLPAPGPLAPVSAPPGAAVQVPVPSASPSPSASGSPGPGAGGAVPLPGGGLGATPSGTTTATTTATGPALGSPARDALLALTAGEHAAVFAYGAVTAWVAPRERNRARTAWAWHVARRDLLEERLLSAGVEPPAAAPAYTLAGTSGPPGAGAAAQLAATVERRVAALSVRTVVATRDDDRRQAAAALVEGARRAAAWTGHGEALPG